MTTGADLVAATRLHLGGRPQLNLLAQNLTSGGTTVTFTRSLAGIQEGSVLSVGLEVLYVWSVDTAALTALVQRAQQGSAAAAHTAGDVVLVNPKFTDWEIFTALNNDLASLSANGLYQIRTLDLTAVAGRTGYDFNATGFLSVADIRWQRPGTVSNEWPEITDFTLSPNMPTGTFPSGTALFLDGPLPTAQQTIRVRYRSALGTLTALTDDVTVTGLPATAADIPPFGAAITVLASRPAARADTSSQGDTRRAAEVSVNDTTGAPAALRVLRAQRISEEATRLAQQWPNRTRASVTL